MKSYLILFLLLITSCVYPQEYQEGVLLMKLSDRALNHRDTVEQEVAEYIHSKTGESVQRVVKVTPSRYERDYGNAFRYIIHFKDKELDMEEMAREVSREYEVVYAQPNYRVARDLLTYQYHDRTTNYLESEYQHINKLPNYHDVIVAVIDSGIDRNHPYLRDSVIVNHQDPINGRDDDNNGYVDDYYGWDFKDYSKTGGDNEPFPEDITNSTHGTRVAGLIAAKYNPSENNRGVNPDAKLLDIGRGFWNIEISQAIRYAVDRGARVINCSFGDIGSGQEVEDAIQYAWDNGAMVVAAAGNENQEGVIYPARFERAIAVTNMYSDFRNYKTTYGKMGTYGDEVDFAALGSHKTTTTSIDYSYGSGSSFSTAFMSGIIARILGFDSSLSPQQVYDILVNASEPLPESGTGHGRIVVKDLLSQFGYNLENRKVYFHNDFGELMHLEVELIEHQGSLIYSRILNFFHKDKLYRIMKDV